MEVTGLKCKGVLNLLSEYICSEVSASQAVEVEIHLENCPTCRMEAENLRSALRALQSPIQRLKVPDVRQAVFSTMTTVKRRNIPYYAKCAISTAAAAVLVISIFATVHRPGLSNKIVERPKPNMKHNTTLPNIYNKSLSVANSGTVRINEKAYQPNNRISQSRKPITPIQRVPIRLENGVTITIVDADRYDAAHPPTRQNYGTQLQAQSADALAQEKMVRYPDPLRMPGRTTPPYANGDIPSTVPRELMPN
jgi:hypothetical protein